MKFAKLFSMLLISLTATVCAGEGSSGVSGGGGTEVNFLALLPEKIEYRANYRWPSFLLPDHKLPDNRYAQELQVRRIFVKSEITHPHQGIQVEFWARSRRDSGSWTRLRHIERVTPLTLIRLLRTGQIDNETASSVQRDGSQYIATGGKFFSLNFNPTYRTDNLRKYDRHAAYLHKRREDYSWTNREKIDAYPRRFEILFDEKTVDVGVLIDLNERMNEVAIRGVVPEQPETLSPLSHFTALASQLYFTTNFDSIAKRIKETMYREAEAMALRILNVVSDDGTSCNNAEFQATEFSIKNWIWGKDEHHLAINLVSGAYIGDGTLSHTLVEQLNQSLDLVRAYCVTSDLSPKNDPSRLLLLDQIVSEKERIKLGELVVK